MSDVFDDIAGGKPNQGGGVYPVAGAYLLYVDMLKMAKNWEGHNVFVASFDVLQSTAKERPAGTKMDDAFNLTKQPKFAPGDVKALVAAVMDVPFDQVDANGLRLAVSDRNPCHGRLVILNASERPTKPKNGQPSHTFTVRKYTAAPPDVQARAEELRKQAGFSPF
jgi:hypothetical protein